MAAGTKKGERKNALTLSKAPKASEQAAEAAGCSAADFAWISRGGPNSFAWAVFTARGGHPTQEGPVKNLTRPRRTRESALAGLPGPRSTRRVELSASLRDALLLN